MTVRLQLAAFALVALIGCSRPASTLRTALAQSGIPASGAVEPLYEETDERAGFWLARLDPAPALPGDSVEIPSSSVLAVFEKQLGRDGVGTPLSEKTPSSEWTATGFRWRASTLSTNRGHYLSLERFKN